MFPTGNAKNRTEFGSPFLLSITGFIAVPDNAKIMLAYIVGGGGSGAVSTGNVGGSMNSGGGGGGGGTFIQIDLERWRWECNLSSASDALIAAATIGAGGLAASTTNSIITGNGGGTTTLTLTGGLSVSVLGGGGGLTNGAASSHGLLATANRTALLAPFFPVSLRPLIALASTYPNSTFSGDVLATGGTASGNVGTEVGNAGGTITGVMVPWWMRQVGMALGAGGNGAALISTGKAAGGGAGGFGGNGGNAAVLNAAGAVTAGTGTGYGSGGGAACGITASTITSGAGAPGCVVAVFGF